MAHIGIDRVCDKRAAHYTFGNIDGFNAHIDSAGGSAGCSCKETAI